MKEIQFTYRIAPHDYQTKLRKITKLLTQGEEIKVMVKFRGREITHVDLGEQLIDRLTNDLESIGRVQYETRLDKNMLRIIFVPTIGIQQ